MKKNIIIAVCLITTLTATAQLPLPQEARTIQVGSGQQFTIRQSTTESIDPKNNHGAIYINKDGVLTLDNADKATVSLTPKSLAHFVVEPGGTLIFQSGQHYDGILSIEANAGSKVRFPDPGDTIAADQIIINAHTATVEVKASLMANVIECHATLFSLIDLANCITDNGVSQSVDEFSRLLLRRTVTSDGKVHTQHIDSYGDYRDAIRNGAGAIIDKIATPDKRRQWRYNIDFAWGFHNWGTEWYNGLAGTSGPSEVRTSFNNLQLSFNYPLLRWDHAALYGGIGLEWDKYKFANPDILFDANAEPYHFATAATASDASTRLRTRYVTVPVMMKIDLGRHWRLEFGAIAGLHWGGKRIGLQYESENGSNHIFERDRSINSHINPYKLDIRAAITYRGHGLYLQLPTLSAFRSTSEELFPVKFGLIF